MKRQPHPQAHLPPLDPDEALRFVALLQRIIDAVWRAHGLAMRERLLDQHVGTSDSDVPLEDQDDLPF